MSSATGRGSHALRELSVAAGMWLSCPHMKDARSSCLPCAGSERAGTISSQEDRSSPSAIEKGVYPKALSSKEENTEETATFKPEKAVDEDSSWWWVTDNHSRTIVI